MANKDKKSPSFPVYLPRPKPEISAWLGEHLKSLRGNLPIERVAKGAGVQAKDIEGIEKGLLHCDLGQFRHIISAGYGQGFEEILGKFYDKFKNVFNTDGAKPFECSFFYAMTAKITQIKNFAPFLIGGDPTSFIWGVPLRHLKTQSTCMDLLELAPARKKTAAGKTTHKAHEGAEIVHVIHGSITVVIDINPEGNNGITLGAGDTIHFNSQTPHNLSNHGMATSALVLITRVR